MTGGMKSVSIETIYLPPQPIRKNIMATQDELKRVAAEKAVEFVPENEYIGIGTGSTINIHRGFGQKRQTD